MAGTDRATMTGKVGVADATGIGVGEKVAEGATTTGSRIAFVSEIDGFAGMYCVSNKGNVKSLERKIWNGKVFCYKKNRGEKIIKQFPNNRGYMVIRLSKRQKTYNKYVHRLVAESFLPNPKGLKQVNHIDGNKKNNELGNLEWVTNMENRIHAKANNLIARKKVMRSDGMVFSSATEAMELTGVNNSSIGKVCKGINKKAGGYSWKYL